MSPSLGMFGLRNSVQLQIYNATATKYFKLRTPLGDFREEICGRDVACICHPVAAKEDYLGTNT